MGWWETLRERGRLEIAIAGIRWRHMSRAHMPSGALIYGNVKLTSGVTWLLEHTRWEIGGAPGWLSW